MKASTHPEASPQYILPAGVVFIVLGAFLIYTMTQINTLKKQVVTLSTSIASTTLAFEKNTNQLSKNISGITETLTDTRQNIDAVKTQVGGVAQTVGSISGTVGVLQKLSEVDPELLKKYSKVYFMSENYVPAHLSIIPPEYTYSSLRPEQFLSEAMPSLKNLLDTAKKDGVTIYVKSSYRSFKEQKNLKSSYKVTYGAGTANTFSADQGYSEHQLGTTVDFITSGLGGALFGFESTQAYTWLLNNAHLYGFVLSYPKGNAYYVYEPWHWRYVGIKLATHLHESQVNFYDMDQREIDKYLVDTLDSF